LTKFRHLPVDHVSEPLITPKSWKDSAAVYLTAYRITKLDEYWMNLRG
jgi:hypothetical protein